MIFGVLLALLCAVSGHAQQPAKALTPAAKEALAAAQAAVQGAQRDMLATREGQRYQETLKALRAVEALIAEASKSEAPAPTAK